MNTKPGPETIDQLRGHAGDLIDGRVATYDAGWKLCFGALGGPTDQHHALWLLWGSLTDWVENKPEETPQAEEAMRRAASEWLEVSHDEMLWRPYFDRWLYAEMGYERPTVMD